MSLFNDRPHAQAFHIDDFFKPDPLPERVSRHLSLVYLLLSGTVLSAAIGVGADLRWHFGGLLSGLCSIGLMIWLAVDPAKHQQGRRAAILSAFGFFNGVSISPLVRVALHTDPSILLTAFLATCTIFVCFSLAAILSTQRRYLYLGGLLSSAVSVLAGLSLAAFFFPSWSGLAYQANLYLGLMVFCGYVLYDTQLLIAQAATSDDVVWHALHLFIDFAAIFVRVLIILLQHAQSNNNKKKKTK